MVFLTSELFVQCMYSPDLSYETLHEREDALTAMLHTLFARFDARAISFTPDEDALQAQCEVPAHMENECHEFCEALAPLLEEGIEGRLLFVRKDLELISLYSIANGAWRECCMTPPPAGEIGEALRKKNLGVKG